MITLPADAPLGSYWVNLVASHTDYDSAQAASVFFVTPPLTMTLDVAPAFVSQNAPITLTVRVYERGTTVSGAGVYAEIATPGGVVTVPLAHSGGFYSMTLRPADLGPNLERAIQGGQWTIQATADYYGSAATDSATVTVAHRLYLPLVLRNY